MIAERHEADQVIIVVAPKQIRHGDVLLAKITVANTGENPLSFTGRRAELQHLVSPGQWNTILAVKTSGGDVQVARGASFEMETRFGITREMTPGSYRVVVYFVGLDALVSDTFEVVAATGG